MSKHKKSPNKKLKQSITQTLRKIFTKNSESDLTHKQVCHLIDVRDGALRKLVFTCWKTLLNKGF